MNLSVPRRVTAVAALAALALGVLLTLAYAASRLRTWRRHPAARF